ncbi:FmdB family zinc ribbon protein [Simplicispira suum]|uniref:FmdB family transcriptional regulator n=1 Tax=Simplicispira suum TaxID=2109915 RepID=A0A2S0MXV0_9BURK|nr:FmdB family zinc ribbon protein [Simplicispira suum]AVO40523.1 FmdB family transcriptional regulator [Simplicispira suum]MBW7832271.1 zinc ribbon domain-containing protein [Simplicispira suum]
MPIYAYKCSACGHARDVLQKMSDPVLTVCPACGAETFAKQLTAAGFQLKGSGWYATDFKGGPTPAAADKGSEAAAPAAAEGAAPIPTKAAPVASAAPAPAVGTAGAD